MLLYERLENKSTWDSRFKPSFTPKELLEMGIFGGKYFNDIKDNFPKDWFTHAKMVKPGEPKNILLNYYQVDASQPLEVWKDNGWIYGDDTHGWMEWYFYYYMGRRNKDIDNIQITRWVKYINRHVGLIKNDVYTPRQAQALLHWAYDIRLIKK